MQQTVVPSYFATFHFFNCYDRNVIISIGEDSKDFSLKAPHFETITACSFFEPSSLTSPRPQKGGRENPEKSCANPSWI